MPVDGDAPGLHRLGQLPFHFDGQKAVVELRLLYDHIVGQAEPPDERPVGDTAIQNRFVVHVRLLPRHCQLVGLNRDGQFIVGKAGNGERDPITVLTQLFNVVRGVVVLDGPLGGLQIPLKDIRYSVEESNTVLIRED